MAKPFAALAAAYRKQVKQLAAITKRFQQAVGRHVRHHVLGQITMYDDVNVALIPKWAKAVAGYVGGNWPTFVKLHGLFPHAKLLSIAIAADEDADALDIERGDATIEQAPAWYARQKKRGVLRPALYIDLADAQKLVDAMTKAGVRRWSYRLITAHYSYKRHFCGPSCGLGFTGHADATQWTDKALGRSLDETICAKGFFG